MHEMRKSVGQSVSLSLCLTVTVCLSVKQTTVLTHSPDGATSMRPFNKIDIDKID